MAKEATYWDTETGYTKTVTMKLDSYELFNAVKKRLKEERNQEISEHIIREATTGSRIHNKDLASDIEAERAFIYDCLSETYPQIVKEIEEMTDPNKNPCTAIFGRLDIEIQTRIKKSIDRELGKIKKNDAISYNETFECEEKATGKKLFVKATTEKKRAELEAIINHTLSRDKRTSDLVAFTDTPSPINCQGIYLTIREWLPQTKEEERNTHYWMAAYAKYHVRAKKVLEENRVKIPTFEYKSFDERLELMDKNKKMINLSRIKQLRKQYQENCEELKHDAQYLLQGDAKTGNTVDGKMIDLEGTALGSPAMDLSITLTQRGIKEQDWLPYLETYLRTRSKEEGVIYTTKDLLGLYDKTRKAKTVSCVRELSGLMRRTIRKEQEKQIEQLYDALISK